MLQEGVDATNPASENSISNASSSGSGNANSTYNMRPSTVEKRNTYNLPGILKKSLKTSKNNFVLIGNDEKLATLLHHIFW